MRRIVANLDCEQEYAASRARDRGIEQHKPALPIQVRRRISAVGTLLRVFGRSDDCLWTLERVSSERMVPALDLPHPRLESGPLDRLSPAEAQLCWGATERTVAVRAARHAVATSHQTPSSARLACSRDGVVQDLWRVGSVESCAAALANDRLVQLELRTGLGLPGAAAVDSLAQIDRESKTEAVAATQGRWVLKAPLSAAGRDRILGDRTTLEQPQLRCRVERLLARFGALLFEPWVERTIDFSCAALLGPASVQIVGLHRLHVRSGGGFDAVCLGRDSCPGLTDDQARQIRDAAVAVGGALRRVGYLGPYGVDGYRYRAPGGASKLNLWGEANARITLGLVGHALAARVWGLHPRVTGICLRVGVAGDMPDEPATVLPLLGPGDNDPTAAWIELLPERPGRR